MASSRTKNKIIDSAKLETEKCIALTNGNRLSMAEYEKADAEFKTLIEIPWLLREPIYIMPEFIDKDTLQPKLQELVIGIEEGKLYHTFIKESYGITWPLLLRLYYGLTSGFKISIEQLHSMMKISYWKDVAGGLESFHFFAADASVSEVFQQHLLTMFFQSESQISEFTARIMDPSIPYGELSVQVFKLTKNYLRYALLGFETMDQDNPVLPKYNKTIEKLKKYPIKYDVIKAIELAKTSGNEMFVSLVRSVIGHYRLVFLDDKPCLIFPTQTLINAYQYAVNPERKLKFVYRLSKFGIETFEKHVLNNERPVNLIAPGISNLLKAHSQLTTEALLIEHDVYHQIIELQISQANHEQLLRAKTALRKCVSDKKTMTTEIFRFLDRECYIAHSDSHKLFYILTGAFLILTGTKKSPLVMSAVILLLDMVLEPAYWPCLAKQKYNLFIGLLPFMKLSYDDDSVHAVELVLKSYAEKVKNNYTVTTILFLCHTYLKDIPLCNALLESHRAPHLYTWRKKNHGHLYPALILSGKDHFIENLAIKTSAERIQLVNQSINKIKNDSAICIQTFFRLHHAKKSIATTPSLQVARLVK